MTKVEKRQIIAALYEKTGAKIDEDDPAFILIELNRLMLARAADDAADRLLLIAKEFSDTAIAQADSFISVANEALSKFTVKTNELKQQIEAVRASQSGQVAASPPAVAVVAAPSALPPVAPPAAATIMKIANIHIAFAIVLLAGVAIGVGLSFFI
jgi:hypothetical protein